MIDFAIRLNKSYSSQQLLDYEGHSRHHRQLRKEDNLRSNKNTPEEPRHGKLGVNNLHKDQDSAQRGISILARMIAEAYIEELDQKRFAEMGVKPLDIEKSR